MVGERSDESQQGGTRTQGEVRISKLENAARRS